MPAWVSPTASNSRKMEDFFTTESGRKLNQHKNSAKKSMILPAGAASASKKHAMAKKRNDFFMETLSGCHVSNDGRGSTSARSYKKA